MSTKTPVTLKLLAQKLKISISTVSKALNDYPTINAYTKERVKQMAAELHFTPNKSALNLQIQKSYTIGIILPDLMDHYFTRSIFGIEQHARQYGYNVIIGQSYDDLKKEVDLANMLLKSRIDGLIIAVSKNTQHFDHLDMFENLGLPIIYYGRNPGFNLSCHKVLSNTYQGCYKATDFLIKRGHQRVAYLGGPKMTSFTHDRFKGYINALNDNHIPFDASLVAYTDFDKENTNHAIKELFYHSKNPPTALVAFKEQILFDAMKYLRANLYEKMEQTEFIGFGNMPFIRYLDNPPLASIEENPESMGENAIKLLLKLIDQKTETTGYQEVMVDCELVLHL